MYLWVIISYRYWYMSVCMYIIHMSMPHKVADATFVFLIVLVAFEACALSLWVCVSNSLLLSYWQQVAEPNSEGMLKQIGICFRYHIFVILSNRMFFDSCASVETNDLQVDTHESTPKVDPTIKATRPQGRSDNHFFHMIFSYFFHICCLVFFPWDVGTIGQI